MEYGVYLSPLKHKVPSTQIKTSFCIYGVQQFCRHLLFAVSQPCTNRANMSLIDGKQKDINKKISNLKYTNLLYGGSLRRFMQVADVGNRSRASSEALPAALHKRFPIVLSFQHKEKDKKINSAMISG